jgi:tetratricopeptide (TPR) repeat protein
MAKKSILVRSTLRKADDFIRQNRLKEASQLYERACQLDGANAELWSRLAILKRGTGEYSRAEYCTRKAVQLSPASAYAHHALGSVLHAQNRLDEAIASYRKAIALEPELSEALYYLANALREKGSLDEAVDAYNALLETEPDHFEGLNNYGALLTNLERSEEAATFLSHALELRPESPETLTNLARAHTLLGSQTIAINLLQRALALRPTFVDAHLELAWAFRLDGKLDAALDCFDKVLTIDPGNRRALVGKAKLHEIRGNYDEASSILEELLSGERKSDALPVFFDVSRQTGRRDKAVSLIQETLKRNDINVAGTAPLHFRLGRHFDQIENYDTAFEHFRQANTLSRRRFPIEKTAAQFGAIRQVYDKDFTRHLPCSTNTSELPIFILGMPRSGTSLIEQIFASHPDVHGIGETNNVMDLTKALARRHATNQFPDFIPKLSQAALDRAASDLEQVLTDLSPSAKRITDKMPHNFIYVGLIFQLFPRCHIIHCRRNPLDTCLSCYVSEFGSNYHNYAYDLNTLGHYYVLYSRLMEHWIRTFPGRIHEVFYDELVDDQERVSRSMLEHCGLEWNPQCLHFHKLNRIINTISYDQVRQPLYKGSVNRWRNYAKHLSSLIEVFDTAGLSY